MKILLLTGIKEELRPVLEQHPFVFDKESRFYRSKEQPLIYAGTTGPGVQKAKELEKFLKQFEPDVVINAGLVGLLNDEDPAEPGDIMKLGTVYDQKSGLQYPGGPGRESLVTVSRPVFQPWEKLDLYVEYFHAKACDMEASKILRLIGEIESIKYKTHVVFCKVIGDRPEAYQLFENEYKIRNWESKSALSKAWTAVRFPGGPYQLKKLLKYKHRALNSLSLHINATILKLLKERQVSPEMNSVFISHLI